MVGRHWAVEEPRARQTQTGFWIRFGPARFASRASYKPSTAGKPPKENEEKHKAQHNTSFTPQQNRMRIDLPSRQAQRRLQR